MSTQKALFLQSRLGTFAVGTCDIPTPEQGELLVEIHATALNPVDWKIQTYDGGIIQEYPAILGTDCAGIVKAVGEGVTDFAIGDRVLHQGLFVNRKATFQQYTTVPAQLAAKIPSNLSFDEASTIPLTMATAALGLYNKSIQPFGGAALSPPWEEGGRGKYAGQPIVVLGGASSVGQHVIQFAKMSGFSPIITTASVRHEDYLKSLGATHVIDRSISLASLPAEVAKVTTEPVLVAYDAVSDAATQNAAFDVLAPGGKVVVMPPPQIDAQKLVDGREVIQVMGNVHVPGQTPVGVSLYGRLTALLEAGDIKPNNVEVLPDGLAGIPDGLERLKRGVSAKKLIVRPQDTI
ncbi:hypothetical protein PHLGIDRAFT_91081 [Phlebiopsis gigantea 11061_1 CR5-6]|uniref:Enoyl reductase (ER) domain-containing protein n=1 Tax=Phlebiopsis gigantea (strain 11061_1 CR5-6) TaxID=745531 RepID=A0A0C3PJC5_PHLG1|nr:hypothetical protein PHLGIDRAFT_91081 [Phlebiopsis gigantea 11061_1 CR5-6]